MALLLDRRRPLLAAIIEHRLSIFMIYANAILSAHEAALEKRHARSSRLWGQPFTIENMLDTLEAALPCPPSERRRPSCRKQPKSLRARKLQINRQSERIIRSRTG
jgi:hypothetical protein